MILAKTRMIPDVKGSTTSPVTMKSGSRVPGPISETAVEGRVHVSFVLGPSEGRQVMRRMNADGGRPSVSTLLALCKGAVDVTVSEVAVAPAASESTTNRLAPPESVMRRAELGLLQAGDLTINPGRHEVIYKGHAVPQLTYTEFGILHFLARHAGWVFNREQIVAGVKGEDYPVTDRAVDVQVAGLRKKLGEAAYLVQTVRGVGYRFRDF